MSVEQLLASVSMFSVYSSTVYNSMQLHDRRDDGDESCTMQYMQTCSSYTHAVYSSTELSWLSCTAYYCILYTVLLHAQLISSLQVSIIR